VKRKPGAAQAAEKIYTYTGPATGITLSDGREAMLHPGQDVALPADDPYVLALVAQKRLKESKAQPTTSKEVTNAG
jgi:hypothetical protein